MIELKRVPLLVVFLGCGLVAGCSAREPSSGIENACHNKCVFYVRADVESAGSGRSWDEAFGTIQEGIDAASEYFIDEGCRCDVWVANGIYYVYRDSVKNSINLREGVSLYGGFEGDEASLDERNMAAPFSIIDGHEFKNSHNRVADLVIGSDNSKMDGFVLRQSQYGGIISLDSSPEISRCVFFDVTNENKNSSATFDDCVFVGGFDSKTQKEPLYCEDSNVAISNSLITGNNGSFCAGSVSSTVVVGNLYNEILNASDTKIEIANSLVAGNYEHFDCVFGFWSSQVSINNSTFLENFSPQGECSIKSTYKSVVNIWNSIIYADKDSSYESGKTCSFNVKNSLLSGWVGGDGNLVSDEYPFVGAVISGLEIGDVELVHEQTQSMITVKGSEALLEGSVAGLFLRIMVNAGVIQGGKEQGYVFPLWLYIVDNTEDGLLVWGDISKLDLASPQVSVFDPHLRSNSACVDAADVQTSEKTDISGVDRDELPDMGAYEN